MKPTRHKAPMAELYEREENSKQVDFVVEFTKLTKSGEGSIEKKIVELQ